MDNTNRLVAAQLTHAILTDLFARDLGSVKPENLPEHAAKVYFAVLDRLNAERKPGVRPREPARFPKLGEVLPEKPLETDVDR